MKQSKSFSSKCEFQLIGGLGNQLFIVLEDLYHRFQGFDSEINVANLEVYGSSHKSYVGDMIFPVSSNFIFNEDSIISSFQNKVQTRISRIIPSKKFGIWSTNDKGEYSQVCNIGLKHLGYFQYLNDVKFSILDLMSRVRLLAPSKKFLELGLQIDDVKPVVIHLRRGDYLNHSTTFGLLHFQYFKNAIEILKLNLTSREFWIFSDDVIAAQELCMFLGISNMRIISNHGKLTAPEEMLLMSRGSALILSNSTFSLWAAYLADPSTEVIHPEPWFRCFPYSKSILLRSWNSIEPLWC